MVRVARATKFGRRARNGSKGIDEMDAGGFQWTLMTVVGAILLAAVIAWAMLRNRTSRAQDEQSERATRRVYEEEEKAHHGEADKVP